MIGCSTMRCVVLHRPISRSHARRDQLCNVNPFMNDSLFFLPAPPDYLAGNESPQVHRFTAFITSKEWHASWQGRMIATKSTIFILLPLLVSMEFDHVI